MPLKIPVTASFPPSTSRGTAVCNGPDIEGMARGAGSGGLVSAGVELGALESAGAVCPKTENAISNTKTGRKYKSRVRKIDLLLDGFVTSAMSYARTPKTT
jgi:hypothetical protein